MRQSGRKTGVRIAAFALVLALFSCSKHSQKPSVAEASALVHSDAEVQSVLAQPGNSLEYSHTVSDPKLETIKFQHFVLGIEVVGSGVAVHSADAAPAVDNHLQKVEVSTTPSYSADEAAALAEKLEPGSAPEDKPALKILPGLGKTPHRLVYIVPLKNHKQVWLDAHHRSHIATVNPHFGRAGAGAEIDGTQHPAASDHPAPLAAIEVRSAALQGLSFDQDFDDNKLASCDIAPLKDDEEDDYETVDAAECNARVAKACQAVTMDGIPLFASPEQCELGKDDSSQRAADNAQKFLRYYRDTFGRDSYDGKGAPVLSMVHAGEHYSDAVWHKDGSVLIYGDGDGKEFRDFTWGLDVAAHEFTHGVIQHSANLLAFGEAGAVNESLADFFGKMVEGDGDWNFGARVFLDGEGNRAFRDLENPGRIESSYKDVTGATHEAPFPSDRKHQAPIIEPCIRTNDSCSVHFNATIPGHSWVLIYKSLGREKAQLLLYTTLTHYLHEQSDFTYTAQATLKACAVQLGRADCETVKSALLQTGMLEQADASPGGLLSHAR
jgi:Zn-dependent metalloprotease